MSLRASIFATCLLCAAASGAESPVTGIWRGQVLFFRITVQAAQWDSQAMGVAEVRGPLGGQYTYHFNGLVESNRLHGVHHSGHRFEGERTAEDRISGLLTTRKGRRFRLELRREEPAP
ncbi:MAG TPA: hypothetical protein P5567_04825 [Kiritimatiellia bacterium]|nr:hypothetical protein [Kiritimatiellia bacterium]HRZ11762.1 hypothetical protein [Kiritimatiellia bacterium]HSA17431.1 hypothetical protein [Kiritimatiellia bacterium]